MTWRCLPPVAAFRSVRLVLLDKDGTITVETGRFEPEPLPLPGAWEGLRAMSALGVRLGVVTNQGWVARGRATMDQVMASNRRLVESLARASVPVLDVFFCPHHPDASDPVLGCECSCRKPRPGLVTAACAAAGVTGSRCLVAGDKLSDVEAAHRAGALGVLVLTGYGMRERGRALADSGEPGPSPALPAGTRTAPQAEPRGTLILPDLVVRDVLRLARFLETLMRGGRPGR